MSVPSNKKELIFTIEDTYLKLKKDLERIPFKITKNKTLEGHAKGTQISICDLLSYLIGWGELVIKWIDRSVNNKVVDFPDTGYQWNELGKLAQKFYMNYKDVSYTKLLEKLEITIDKILKIIQVTENKMLYEKTWYKKYSMGKMIQLNTSSPYKNARIRVRKWKKEQNI